MTRELDAKVATVLGLDVVGEGWAYPDPEVPGWWHPISEMHSGNKMQPMYVAHCICDQHSDWALPVPAKMLWHYPGCLEVVPFYSDDIAIARTMEDWIEENRPDLCDGYACALYDMVSDKSRVSMARTWWAMLHATPEQRCRALLAAVGK